MSLPSGPSAAPLRRLTAAGQGADTRPWVITGLVAALAAAPALQAASLSGLRLLVALAWIALLQLPAARRYAPSLRPAEVHARLLGRWGGRDRPTRGDEHGSRPHGP